MTTDALLVEAFQAVQQELPELAGELFQRVLRREPGNPAVLLELGRCYLLQCRRSEAVRTLGLAEQAVLDDPELPLELGRAWRQAGDAERARHWFRSVGADSPFAGAAMLEELLLEDRRHDLEGAAAVVQRCAGAPAALRGMAEGLLAVRQGDHDRAVAGLRAAMEQAPGSPLGVEAAGQLGRLLLRVGRAEEAFGVLAAGKGWEKAAFTPEHARRLAARRAFDLQTLECVDDAWCRRVEDSSPAAPPLPMILGHPRSGTTLLARLMADRGWRWVDEAPAFTAMARVRTKGWPDAGSPAGMARRLAGLTEKERSGARRDYEARLADWGAVSSHAGPALDKNPGLSASLPGLMALLPGWHGIYLLRDPRDVALSCYTQNFGPSLLGWACQTLEGAAAAVEHCLRLWLRLRTILPAHRITELHYEDLAARPSLLDECPELQPHEAASAAPAGPERLVENPSYASVKEAPHGRAEGRWRKLPEALAAPLRRLDAIAAEAGY